jgi:transposase InsO family protein
MRENAIGARRVKKFKVTTNSRHLKLELVEWERFETRWEAKGKVFDYIEVFYNRSRIHSATDYLSPAEYEEKFRQAA